MELTVVVSYYKAIDNLKIILQALNNQSNNNFELILSEDDYNENTIKFILDNKHLYSFPITHLYQKEDNGFRKNSMLNRCIIASKAEKIAFIDGDCIPHKHFVKAYLNQLETGCFFAGRAVMLGEKISKRIIEKQSLKQMSFFALLFTSSEKVKDAIYFPYLSLSHKTRGLVGRNWGVNKKHLIDINGFDNDYVRPGVGEDTDVEWRLIESGVKMKSIKNKAIVYHIYHPRTYTQKEVRFNYDLMAKKQKANNYVCLSGINTFAIQNESDLD